MSCHDYEGVMPVLCTPLQVKCYPELHNAEIKQVNHVEILN